MCAIIQLHSTVLIQFWRIVKRKKAHTHTHKCTNRKTQRIYDLLFLLLSLVFFSSSLCKTFIMHCTKWYRIGNISFLSYLLHYIYCCAPIKTRSETMIACTRLHLIFFFRDSLDFTLSTVAKICYQRKIQLRRIFLADEHNKKRESLFQCYRGKKKIHWKKEK